MRTIHRGRIPAILAVFAAFALANPGAQSVAQTTGGAAGDTSPKAGGPSAHAAEASSLPAPVYYDLSLSDLTLAGGQLPADSKDSPDSPDYHRRFERAFRLGGAMAPYAVGEKGVEILIDISASAQNFPAIPDEASRATWRIRIEAPAGVAPKGRMLIPNSDLSAMTSVDFTVAKEPASDQKSAREGFLRARIAQYESLLGRGVPGAAWFRHRIRETRKQLGETDSPPTRRFREDEFAMGGRPPRTGEFDETFDLFTGGQALSENLQLDRTLNVVSASSETLPLESISGIETAAYDWKKAIEGATPNPDSLAAVIPIDQHALFFPSFQAMLSLMDEAAQRGTPILHLLQPQSSEADTRSRYERQLCLQTDALSRLFGPTLIASVAFTGSDPYLRTGSDVAVLFEAIEPKALETTLAARQQAAAKADGNAANAKSVTGEIGGVSYVGLIAPDRSICSYRATLGKIVVVTNSLHQLDRIIQTSKGSSPNLASAGEYAFFRMRYPRDDSAETALVVLSDATIRRWCGPKWRIGASRRTRAAAVLCELQAEHLREIATGSLKTGPLQLADPVPGLGDVQVSQRGLSSSIYGSLEFLTPIAELPLVKVTEEESRAYERFRMGYQSNWRQYFDPIAIRFTVAGGRVAADVTVRPLIAGSDYRPVMEVVGQKPLDDKAGDPHPEAVFQVVASLDPDSAPVKQATGFVGMAAPGLGDNPLNWIGTWITLFADEDPFWRDLEAAAKDGEQGMETFMEKNAIRLPLALEVNISGPLKVAAFLTALRAYIEQSAPGMAVWETRTHNEQSYVRVTASETAKAEMGEDEGMKDLAVYYAPTPRALIVTLNEEVLKRALDRAAAKSAASATTPAATPTGAAPASPSVSLPNWAGSNLALRSGSTGLNILKTLYSESLTQEFQRRSWGNLPILNEWKQRFDQSDPVAFHQKVWSVRLVDPAGGSYVWNEELRTMESTTFGCPAKPRAAESVPDPLSDVRILDLGLTFEGDGIRARGELTRPSK